MGHVSLALVLHVRAPTTGAQPLPPRPPILGPHDNPVPSTLRPPHSLTELHLTLLDPPAQRNPLSLPRRPTHHGLRRPVRIVHQHPPPPTPPVQTHNIHSPPIQRAHSRDINRPPPPSLVANIPRRHGVDVSARALAQLRPQTTDPGPPEQPRAANRRDTLPRRARLEAARSTGLHPPRVAGRTQTDDPIHAAHAMDLRQIRQPDRVPHADFLGPVRLRRRRRPRARHRGMGHCRQDPRAGKPTHPQS